MQAERARQPTRFPRGCRRAAGADQRREAGGVGRARAAPRALRDTPPAAGTRRARRRASRADVGQKSRAMSPPPTCMFQLTTTRRSAWPARPGRRRPTTGGPTLRRQLPQRAAIARQLRRHPRTAGGSTVELDLSDGHERMAAGTAVTARPCASVSRRRGCDDCASMDIKL